MNAVFKALIFGLSIAFKEQPSEIPQLPEAWKKNLLKLSEKFREKMPSLPHFDLKTGFHK